ncbi:Gp37 family protein [Maritalea porphyrae]|uniref:Gp37 family protein n=1 Tax=Maritalea porphyrae TaxID=880732 RepID=UPI0022B03DC8|nr:Gp37 family protein [Maritalea porphyrae]MCZ4273306.1 Gp37 family protein [Maritalea porphyrae]
MTNAPKCQIEKIQDQIVARLKDQVGSKFYIDAFPANPSQFDPAMMDAAILVNYAGSRYGAFRETDTSQQMRDMRFLLVLHVQNLVKPSQAYEHLETIRKAVQSVPLEGSTPIKLVSEQLAGQDAGQWEWHIEIALTTNAVAAFTPYTPPRVPLNIFTKE